MNIIKKVLLYIPFVGIVSCSPSGETLPDGRYEMVDIQTDSPEILDEALSSLPSFVFSGNTLKVRNGDLAGFFADSVYTYTLEKDYLCLQSDTRNCRIAMEADHSGNIFKLWIMSNGIKLIQIRRE